MRFFRLGLSILAGAALALAAACGGGGGGTIPANQVTKTISGTATYGSARAASAVQALDGAAVTVEDANGVTISVAATETDANGDYSVQVRYNQGNTVHAFVRVQRADVTIKAVIPNLHDQGATVAQNVTPVTNQQAVQYREQLQSAAGDDKNSITLDAVPLPEAPSPDRVDVDLGVRDADVNNVGVAVYLAGQALIQGLEDAEAADQAISFTQAQQDDFLAAYYRLVGQLVDEVMDILIANDGTITVTALLTAIENLDDSNVAIMFDIIGLDTEKFFRVLGAARQIYEAYETEGVPTTLQGWQSAYLSVLKDAGLSDAEIIGILYRVYQLTNDSVANPTVEELVRTITVVFAAADADDDQVELILTSMVEAVQASYNDNKAQYDAAWTSGQNIYDAVEQNVDDAAKARLLADYLATKGFSESAAFILDTYRP